MSKLKEIRSFRKIRIKTCGNCRHLKSLDHGMRLKCARPSRKATPTWMHHSGNYAEDVYGDIWQHVCDRWSRKDDARTIY